MRHRNRKIAGLAAGAALALLAGAAPAAAADAPTVVLSGLTGAKGVNVDGNGDVLFAQAGPGGGGVLQERVYYGAQKGQTVTLTSLPDVPSDVAPAGRGDAWVLFGAPPEDGPPPAGSPAFHLYLWSPRGGGSLTDVADLGAFAAAHPDPNDQEGIPGESNPYGLATLQDGSVLVTDAAANSLLRVQRTGQVELIAHLPTQDVSTAGTGIPGLPPTLTAEAVPTSVTVGADGAWYVGELKGFPFTKGASRVWRIRPSTRGAVCSATAVNGPCSVYATGFTSIIDLTKDRDGGLLVLQLTDDLLGLEGAAEGGPVPPGFLYRLTNGVRTELAPGQLVLPGGVAVNPWTGAVYVTDFQLIPELGRLLRVPR